MVTTPDTAELMASERLTAANSLIKNYVIAAATGLGRVKTWLRSSRTRRLPNRQ